MFILILIVVIIILVILPVPQKEQHIKRENAVTMEAITKVRINKLLQDEKQLNQRKSALYKEFYMSNPHGTPFEFKKWVKETNVIDKAKNPRRYVATVKKPPKKQKRG